MKNIRMTVSYDGTRYYGFQTQPGGNTVQDHLEKAIFHLTQEEVKVIGSGRTDAGVHAKGQVINFHTRSPIPPSNWMKAMNSKLPDDIIVMESKEVPLDFHARKDAVAKTYCYFINLGPVMDVFHKRYELHYPKPLNIDHMIQAAKILEGTHDFTSFTSIHSQQRSHIRTIHEIQLEQWKHGYENGQKLKLTITGNGFLYNMVRIITGTLIEVGQGKRNWKEISSILEAKDRSKAGPTAPGHGLFLWRVNYPDE